MRTVQKLPPMMSARSAISRPRFDRSHAVRPVHQLERRIGSQARQWMPQTQANTVAGDTLSSAAPFGHDFSGIPVHFRTETHASEHHGSSSVRDKSVNGVSEDDDGIVRDQAPDAGTGSKDAGAPVSPAVKKKAGVESFEVKWAKSSGNGPKALRLRLDYAVKFKKDATYDPAAAEFRQNAFHKFEVTAGPNKGLKSDNSPLHDDNYSRADDTAGNAITDTKFVCNDNPGTQDDSLDKDDVVDYTFTAEQKIIDTSDGNKEVQKKGPHTATIKGKHPRAVDGVPTTL